MQGPEFQERASVKKFQAQLVSAYRESLEMKPPYTQLDTKFGEINLSQEFKDLPMERGLLVLGAYQVLVRLLTPGRS